MLKCRLEELSTPHGTLGTLNETKDNIDTKILSTPHGTLGTPNDHIN